MNLETFKNKTILLFGKPRAFSEDEFSSQLKQHKISITKELREDVDTILEGRVISPYEQNLSDELYETGNYTFIKIDAFEKALAKEIDDDVLLMSLKLANDKERLKNFIKNACVRDALFFKLLKMYKWSGEDFFENDDNRDVTAALIGRFYENIERNHNVQYATTGLIHLSLQTQNEALLEAISELEPIQLHPKLNIILAKHSKTPQKVLKRFLRTGNKEVLEAMTTNAELNKEIAKELIKDADLAKNIAQTIKLDAELFEKLSEYKKYLAYNGSLNGAMQEELFMLEDDEVNLSLAQNSNIDKSIVQALLELKDESLTQALYANPAVEVAILTEAYQDEKNHLSLSRNANTPKDILEKLYQLGESNILENLARNENTPIEILYQLQLESRFERAVKTNEAFGRYIQGENIGWL